MKLLFQLAAWALLLASAAVYWYGSSGWVLGLPGGFLPLFWLPAAGVLLARGLPSRRADDRAWWLAPFAVAFVHLVALAAWANHCGRLSDVELLLTGAWSNTLVASVAGLALDRRHPQRLADDE